MDLLCKSIEWFLHDSDVFIDLISFSGVCMLESGFKFSLAIKYFYLLNILFQAIFYNSSPTAPNTLQRF